MNFVEFSFKILLFLLEYSFICQNATNNFSAIIVILNINKFTDALGPMVDDEVFWSTSSLSEETIDPRLSKANQSNVTLTSMVLS